MGEDVNQNSPPKNWDRSGLPGWTYHSHALLELEIEIFKTHWQIACHVSDVPNAGDFKTFDLCGERAIIIRDSSLKIKAFHNICRHRGSRLVTQDQGTCKNALICPFHGWVYNLDGTLRGAARPDTFPALDKDEFALRTVEHEVWNGFVFVRFKQGPQPSVKELLSCYEKEATSYNISNQVPTDGFWTEMSPVNWKSIRDVDNEGYHVAMAIPAYKTYMARITETNRMKMVCHALKVNSLSRRVDIGLFVIIRNFLKNKNHFQKALMHPCLKRQSEVHEDEHYQNVYSNPSSF